MSNHVRVTAIQARNRTIPYTRTGTEALSQIRSTIAILTGLAEAAADEGARIVALPEDTLGTFEWEAGHPQELESFLMEAEKLMLDRFAEVAARRRVSVICCNDCAHEGRIRNTAILIGPDGAEIGRYVKVHPALAERTREPGTGFPVYEVPEVGSVGMCICYDMMMPETTRALALNGADIVFDLTMGGASLASGSASLAAFRTRAADNYLYIVVAFRSGGSLIISPRGEILAEGGNEPDALVSATIDPTTDREAGDALTGLTSDFRARLFRERNPAAYGVLTDPNPPAMERLKDVPVPTIEEAAALMARALTTGADEFAQAEKLAGAGDLTGARDRFTQLAGIFGTTWIGRRSQERLQELG